MPSRDQNQDDLIPRGQISDPVNHHGVDQFPTIGGRRENPLDACLGHAGVVFEVESIHRVGPGTITHDAREGDNGTRPAAETRPQGAPLGRNIKVVGLDANVGSQGG